MVTLTDSGAQARQLTDTDAFEYDAKVSPDGGFVSFVRDGAVYAIDLARSEEHTSELQSPVPISYAVFCLKKKKKKKNENNL